MQLLICIFVSFGASVVGAVCGIGGGILMKPVLDATGMMEVQATSFLSGCTVLSMSCISVAKSLRRRDSEVDLHRVTPLGIGAALGGLLGKSLFDLFLAAVGVGTAKMAQAAILMAVTLGTILYTVLQDKIRPRHLDQVLACVLAGFLLGGMSSFLGIGGGPVNIVLLIFLFGMDNKQAAKNSLYIIFLSQLVSLLYTLGTRSVPAFQPPVLAAMVLCGFLGGIAGGKINRRIPAQAVRKLFLGLMGVIVAICIFNILRVVTL